MLSPALAVVLGDLGLRDRVVGRHGFDTVLDESVPVCGDQGGINYEALLRAEPTHVLTEWGSRELPARLRSLAESEGWIIRDFRMLTLEEIDLAATALAELFAGAQPSRRARRLHEFLTGPAPEPIWPGRVLLLMDASPTAAALGPGSAHQELLVRVGGVPALAEGSPYMTLHAEDIARLAPDAIILIQPRADARVGQPPTDAALRQRLGRLATLDIPAVEAGRVAAIEHPLGLLPSTALADLADEIEARLTEWAGR